MLLPPAIEIVNGTHIVPLYFPTEFTPSQLDKLGWTAIITLGWPTLVGIFALVVGTRDWNRYSYTSLSIAWFASTISVAIGIFTRYGVYDHLLHFLAITHVQIEWFMISFLLGYRFHHGFIIASLVDLFLLFTALGLPGIRSTFVIATVLGGVGDAFLPLLLWHGGQRILALGAIAHFTNVITTFYGFVEYIPVGPYLAFELLSGGLQVLFTVVGIFCLEKPAIRLEEGPEEGSADAFQPIIPPPDRHTIIKLGLLAAGAALLAAIPLNFFPKYAL